MNRTLSVALAATVLAGFAVAGELQPFTGKITRIEPIRMAQVKYVNGKVIMLTPWIKYQPGAGNARVGTLSFNAFEGNSVNDANPDDPTDGVLFGNPPTNEQIFFGTANGDTFEPGTRWFRGNGYCNTLLARGMKKLYPGKENSLALGIDMMMYTEVDEQFYFLQVPGETWSDTTAPGLTDFTPGIIWDFGPLAPGGYYANADLTGAGIDWKLPAVNGNGGWLQAFGNFYDEGTGDLTLSTLAQPLQWGCDRDNPSQVSDVMFQDGGDSGDPNQRDGSLDDESPLGQTLLRPTTRLKRPVSYTVTRGVEVGSNDPAKLQANDDNKVRVQQRFQFAPTLPNAEITAVITLDSDVNLADIRTFRVTSHMQANSLPFSDNSCRQEIALRNWTTGAVNVIDTRKPTSTESAVRALNVHYIGTPRNQDYMRTSDRRVEVLVRVYHLQPISPAWEMQVDTIELLHARSGPLPLCPAFATSNP